MNKNLLKDKVVHLKYINGHEIWVLKSLINGYKYLGIYDGKLKQKEKKNE